MNDAVGKPENIMEAFMYRSQQQQQTAVTTSNFTRSGGRVTRASEVASVDDMENISSAGF